MRFGVLLLIVGTFFCSALASAEIYKWTDGQGVVHFQDTPPANPAPAQRLETRIETVYEEGPVAEPGPTGASRAPVSSPAKPAIFGNPTVEVYLTSWCPWCKKTMAFFASRGIKAKAYDIEKDSAAAGRKARLGSSPGVPTTVINGMVIDGYAPAAFDNALKSAK